MSNFFKKITIFSFAVIGFLFAFNSANAQLAECQINSAGTSFRPGGGSTISYSDVDRPYIYLDVSTNTQCNRIIIRFLSGTASSGAPVPIAEYNVRVGPTWSNANLPAGTLVSPSNQFSLAILLGETGPLGGCDDTNGSCNLQAQIINRTMVSSPTTLGVATPDSTFDTVIHSIPNSAGVNFTCQGSCNTPWQVNTPICTGVVNYSGVCQSDNGTITIIDPGTLNGVDSSGNGDTSIFSEEPLAPLPGFSNAPDLGEFLEALFTILIVIAGILALVMIIVGAMTYMTSDAFGKKEQGKVFIINAIFGLILALSAWIILNTINPNLASDLSISIPQITFDAPRKEWNDGNAAQGTNIAPNILLGGQPILQGMPWPDDAVQRGQLSAAGISVVSSGNSNCTPTAGTPACTSVYFEGDAASVIDQIISLKNTCNCEIVVTGGSEAWLHQTHGPNVKVIDIRATDSFNSYINSVSNSSATGSTFPSGKWIRLDGFGRFYAEPSGSTSNTTNQHWHVIFD